MDFPALWARATPWREFFRPEMESYALWRGVADHVTIPEWALQEFGTAKLRRLLVLAEDWCGDAANSVPVLAGLAGQVEGMELRVLERDRYPEVMAAYLTDGTRSIPIAIGLDRDYRELGHWGPRPLALQTWTMANKATIPSPQRYAYARKWYARDRGETTLRELLAAVSGER